MYRSYDRLVSRLSRRELMKVVGLAGAAAIAHPNLRAHQLIATAVSDAMRDAGVPRPAEEWRDGYVETEPEELYRDQPELRILELETRVFVCILAPRESCPDEAQRLLVLQPQNEIAARVLRE